MSMKDRYGNELGTTSADARDAYQAGMDSLMSATPGMDAAFQKAVEADDGFALGHIALARAKQLLGRGHEAKAPLARAQELAPGASARERSQIAIFEKILTGQGAAALDAIREHMKDWPRDAMALAPATSVFGLIGFSGRVGREQEQLEILVPFEKHYGGDWWYLTQLAFAQIELGQFEEGRHNIEKALADYPKSAHAAHIHGHLFYETGEREAGLAYLTDWMKDYPRDGLMHCHNSWHLALWSMETGKHADAWRIYDDALRPGAAWGPQINVATDCPAFLLRAEMAGEPRQPERWREIADYATKWFGRPGLGFVDMHTALAYAMAGDVEVLAKFAESPRGATADLLPLLATGFSAFAAGNWQHAIGAIRPLLDTHERLGGSRAQRDLLEYVVTAAMVRDGKSGEAREFILQRRPQNGKGRGFPISGL
jgi:tetratricopeptide (TPR) repeat protein